MTFHTVRSYARVGIMGNPSDGFHGKTIASTIANYYAEVTVERAAVFEVVPHSECDLTTFSSLDALAARVARVGYVGGQRLVLAACAVLQRHCAERGIALHSTPARLSYRTTIPRQVGLAGSSAIVTATFRALMLHYELTEEHIPLPLQAQLCLDAEVRELGIAAGLQDRVAQVYNALVFMDFDEAGMKARGHGAYTRMAGEALPLFLAYCTRPTDSGKIHHTVTERWRSGDKQVRAAMQRFADLTTQAAECLAKGDTFDGLGALMTANFDNRRALYGDAVIGPDNLRMVEIARGLGAHAKLPGSGGAVVGVYKDTAQLAALQEAYTAESFVCIPLTLHNPPQPQ